MKQWDDSKISHIEFGLPETLFNGGRPPIDLKDPTYEVEKLQMA